MEHRVITPVILCGGAGTRLWPMSREDCPKQFLKLHSHHYSLFQETLLRTSHQLGMAPPLVVSNRAYAAQVETQAAAIGLEDINVVYEPSSRNTAPALAAVACYLQRQDETALMLVLPVDHVMREPQMFLHRVREAASFALEGNIMTFGVWPSSPETGYGYIKPGDALVDGVYKIGKFAEKPDNHQVQHYLEQGYLWNSGIFLLTAARYLEELERFAPDVTLAVTRSVQAGTSSGMHFYPEAEAFNISPAISIDYAVMEHTDRACVVPVSCGWEDIGSWNALWKLYGEEAVGEQAVKKLLEVVARNRTA